MVQRRGPSRAQRLPFEDAEALQMGGIYMHLCWCLHVFTWISLHQVCSLLWRQDSIPPSHLCRPGAKHVSSLAAREALTTAKSGRGSGTGPERHALRGRWRPWQLPRVSVTRQDAGKVRLAGRWQPRGLEILHRPMQHV